MRHAVSVFTVLLFTVVAFGQAASPSPALPAVDSLSKWLSDHLASTSVALVLLVELVARLVPTAKPQSLFVWLSSGLKSLAHLLEVLSQYADKVLQNVKS